ncbi:hypothetical protein [Nocardia sp. NPDC052112]|uniref:hypothetical protein n=1 Tax=Nocardia sp. NPDC052112 TaxID=3155646 RepID=UPI003413E44E
MDPSESCAGRVLSPRKRTEHRERAAAPPNARAVPPSGHTTPRSFSSSRLTYPERS